MKLVQIYGDRNIRSGNARTTETHLDVFARVLRKYGWRVAIMAGSYNWAHLDKFFFMDEILREENTRLPKVRFNLRNAKVVMMSIHQTPILDNFEKDKKSERGSIPQELATHLCIVLKKHYKSSSKSLNLLILRPTINALSFYNLKKYRNLSDNVFNITRPN